MKRLTMSALVAAQIALAAQPACAADFGDQRADAGQQHGAFAGARLRIPLGGAAGDRKARAGLTMAPVTQGRQTDGSIRTRFGEGVEYRFAGGSKPELAFGGRSMSQGRAGPDGRKMGISTLGWVGIGVGVVAVILVTAFVWCDADNDCPPGE